MAKYLVTGGESGESGVHLHGKRYEPGDVVEVANPKKLWLIDEGYLVLASKAKTKGASDDDDGGE